MNEVIGHESRRAWRALASGAFLLALAACGGGGAGAPTAPTGTTSGPESAYLDAEFVAQDSNNQFVHVWDPAAPTVAIEDVRIVETNGIVWKDSHLAFSDATRYDPSTGTMTSLGHAKVYYENDGKIYAIDLRGGRSHAPVQLSSVTDVSGDVRLVASLTADGSDAWILAEGGDHAWAIRSTMAATDAAQDATDMVPLRDPATGLPQVFFVTFGGGAGHRILPITFGVRDPAFAPVPSPAVDAMVPGDGWVGTDPAVASLGYVKTSGQLHEAHWDSAGVTVEAADLYDFGPIAFAAPAVTDATTLYAADGRTLVAIRDGDARALGAFQNLPDTLVDAGDYVVASESIPLAPVCCAAIESARKADGVFTTLAGGYADQQLYGASATLVYEGDGSPDADAPGFNSLAPDGSATTPLAGAFVGFVRPAASRPGQASAPTAMIVCAASGSVFGYCGAGDLLQVDLATGAQTTLGTLAEGDVWLRGDFVEGATGVLIVQTFLQTLAGFGGDEVDTRDAWQLTPGVAGSLKRVTTFLP